MRGGGDSKPVIEQEILKQVQDDINLPLKRTYLPVHLLPHKFFAFTLAEVLITLGIIGVVAALTIPTLISNHQKKVYVTQFKKVYNTVTNAFKLMQAETGTDNLLDNDFMTALTVQSSSNEAEVTRLAKKYFNIAQDVKFYSPLSSSEYKYLFYGNGSATTNPTGYLLRTVDGADIYLFVQAYSDYFSIEIDVNGSERGPNTAGRDFFSISFYKNGQPSFSWDSNDAVNYCGGNQTHVGEASACAQRIMHDGWEMNY